MAKRRIDVGLQFNQTRFNMGTKTRGRVKPPSRACATGKIVYETIATAQVIAERSMEAGDVDPGCHVEAYLCRTCQGFHIGNRKIIFRDDD